MGMNRRPKRYIWKSVTRIRLVEVEAADTQTSSGRMMHSHEKVRVSL